MIEQFAVLLTDAPAGVVTNVGRPACRRPILPLAPGMPERQSRDYERHGVTSLHAAMDVNSGVTISTRYRRHRHQEFLRFLNQIEEDVPEKLDVHLVMDNYGTHKVEKVRKWMARHPRYHVHFTPTSGSWLNLVERSFADVTEPLCVAWQPHRSSRPGDSYARLSEPPE